jgi:L-lysine exporter family protein LysE/ArgO
MIGLLLGWGAAIPLGPINLEIIRRNININTRSGIALGLGACTADLTYLFLLLAGALTILNHVIILKIIGFVGALIIAWFGYSAIKLPISKMKSSVPIKTKSFAKGIWDGYILTLINPFTILFWSSLSVTIAVTVKSSQQTMLIVSLGVLSAVVSWVIGLNSVLHFTRHFISERLMRWMNIAGGCVLFGFALYSIWHVLKM